VQPVKLDPNPLEPNTRAVLFIGNGKDVADLPALIYPEGSILTRWQPNDEERQAIARGEPLDLWVWTFGKPLQPMHLSVYSVSGD
jgi:hypothetical protein